MQKITIGVPFFERNQYMVRIVANIVIENGCEKTNKMLWYETSDKWASMFVYERADAFLVGLIPFIARNGGKVVCEAPVSAHLLHNLRYLLSPVLPQFHPDLVELDIEAKEDSTLFSANGAYNVGTGCSCGIDSMATMAIYSGSTVPDSLRVNHLTFFDVGSHEKKEELARARTTLAEKCADFMGVPLVKISSNIDDFSAGFSHIAIHTFRSMSAVLVLQKLFAAYHYASAYPISKFKISSEGIAYADEYVLRCLSTESTRLYSSLPPLNRQNRTAVVSEFAIAAKFLNVCVRDICNCGLCFKCARTMFQLDLIGKLDVFKEVFDVGAYHRNKKTILKLLARDTHFHDEFLEATRLSKNPPYSYFRLKMVFLRRRLSERIVKIRKMVKSKFRK